MRSEIEVVKLKKNPNNKNEINKNPNTHTHTKPNHKTRRIIESFNCIVISLYPLQTKISLERHPVPLFCCTIHVMKIRAGVAYKTNVVLAFQNS